MASVPQELGPAVFLPPEAKAPYWREGARLAREGRTQLEAIRGGLLAARREFDRTA
jgi:hypothetical protein